MRSFSDPENTEKDSLKGIDFVFDTCCKMVDQQMQSGNAIDVKTGVLIGFLMLFITVALDFLFKNIGKIIKIPYYLGYLTVSGLIVVIISFLYILLCYKPKTFLSIINVKKLVEWTNEEEKDIKDYFLEGVIYAYNYNTNIISAKTKAFKTTIFFVFAGVVIFLLPAILTLLN